MFSYRSLRALVFVAFVSACAVNPFTGKKTMALVPNSQIFPMAFQEYDQFLSSNKVITNTPDAQRIKTIGQKISRAAERWLNANGYAGYLKDYKWQLKRLTYRNTEWERNFLQRELDFNVAKERFIKFIVEKRFVS